AQLPPGLAAVSGFEYAAASSIPGSIFPGPFPGFPQRRVSGVRVCRVEQHVCAACVLVFVEDFCKSLSAIDGAKNASLLIRAVRMAGNCDQNAVRIARIDCYLRNLLAVT